MKVGWACFVADNTTIFFQRKRVQVVTRSQQFVMESHSTKNCSKKARYIFMTTLSCRRDSQTWKVIYLNASKSLKKYLETGFKYFDQNGNGASTSSTFTMKDGKWFGYVNLSAKFYLIEPCENGAEDCYIIKEFTWYHQAHMSFNNCIPKKVNIQYIFHCWFCIWLVSYSAISQCSCVSLWKEDCIHFRKSTIKNSIYNPGRRSTNDKTERYSYYRVWESYSQKKRWRNKSWQIWYWPLFENMTLSYRLRTFVILAFSCFVIGNGAACPEEGF